jgi:hypothetical protein
MATNAEHETTRQAAIIAAAALRLKPEDPLSAKRGLEFTFARWITWAILRDVGRWSVSRIARVTSFSWGGVTKGLASLEKRQKRDKHLRAMLEACLKEAAGGGG